jgi:broad specificity phosphatase PhoE
MGEGKNIVLVSSGGIIGTTVQMVLGFSDETTMQLTMEISKYIDDKSTI